MDYEEFPIPLIRFFVHIHINNQFMRIYAKLIPNLLSLHLKGFSGELVISCEMMFCTCRSVCVCVCFPINRNNMILRSEIIHSDLNHAFFDLIN